MKAQKKAYPVANSAAGLRGRAVPARKYRAPMKGKGGY